MSEVKKNKLISFWEEKTKEIIDAFKMKNAAKSLQRQAEIDVAKALETLDKAKEKLENAKLKAKEKSEFQPIVDAFMEVKVASKRFDDAVEVYKELFEEEPKLL